MLQTVYVLNKEILQFLGQKSAVYNWECFQIKSGLWWGYDGSRTVRGGSRIWPSAKIGHRAWSRKSALAIISYHIIVLSLYYHYHYWTFIAKDKPSALAMRDLLNAAIDVAKVGSHCCHIKMMRSEIMWEVEWDEIWNKNHDALTRWNISYPLWLTQTPTGILQV